MFIFIKPDILVFVKTVHIFICLRCISIDYQRQFTKVERRRQEVEGLLRERGEGWRARGRSEETLYESLSYRELQGEQRSKSWKEQVLLLVKVDKLWVKAGCQEKPKLRISFLH